MALWLLCCVLLFITSRGYDWLSQQSWFWAPEISLPWLVLGGIGLAIASNRRSLAALAASEEPLSGPPTFSATQPPPLVTGTPTQPTAPMNRTAAPSPPPSRAKTSATNRSDQQTSISFTVSRPPKRSPSPTADSPPIDAACE